MKRFYGIAAVVSTVVAFFATSATAETTWAYANGQELRYELTGPADGKVLVLVHEMGMTLESWDYLMPLLPKDRRILRYDMRGFGLSQRFHKREVTMDDGAEDLRALLDVLGIQESVTLAGGAVGADVALVFAMKYQQRVRGVAAFSAAINLNPGPLSEWRPPRTPEQIQSDERYYGTYPKVLQDADKERFLRFKAIQAANDDMSEQTTARMVASFDFTPILPKINVPVLMAGTALGGPRNEEFVRKITAMLPKGKFLWLQTGHYAAWQSPEMVAPALIAFMNEVGG